MDGFFGITRGFFGIKLNFTELQGIFPELDRFFPESQLFFPELHNSRGISLAHLQKARIESRFLIKVAASFIIPSEIRSRDRLLGIPI